MIKNIILTGTHHTPAHQLILTLKKDPLVNWKIHYLGRKYNFQGQNTLSTEYQFFPSFGVNFHPITSGRFNRQSVLKTVTGTLDSVKGFFQSCRLVREIQPAITVSFGGYLSVPVIIASCLHRIPTITHEQTTTLSLSTKLNSFFVKKIALSFDLPTLFPQKTVVTGNLLRQEIFFCQSPGPFLHFKKHLKKPKKLLYITGGNQGASFLNETVLSILPALIKKNYLVIHQTGSQDYTKIKHQTQKISTDFYHPIPFVSSRHLGWVFKNSDLIISRSGANICQEIAVFHKKAIFIPLPGSQNNEQKKNAIWTKTYAPATILLQNTCRPQKLLRLILKNQKTKNPKNYPDLDFQKAPQKLLQLIHHLSS